MRRKAGFDFYQYAKLADTFDLSLLNPKGISLGHKYYEKHPEAEFLDKLRRRLVELSEFFTDSSIQVKCSSLYSDTAS